MKQLQAIRALRWIGVLAWLRAPDTRKPFGGGWRKLLREPETVIMEQTGLADGVFL